MKVLQCGYPRSGNYLLWKILRRCQEMVGEYSSFSTRSGIGSLVEKIYKVLGLKPYFNEVFEMDEIEVKDGDIYFYKVLREDGVLSSFLDVDLNLLFSVSSLVWSHTSPDVLDKCDVLEYFDKRFYILRDGRAVINSLMHHVVRKEVLSTYPIYKYVTVDEVYGDFSLFRRYVSAWERHVSSFLAMRDKFTLIRFEDLTRSCVGMKVILSTFGLEKMLESFMSEFSFSNMKKSASTHLRKGDDNDWRNFFTDGHKDIFKEIAGNLLVKLGYEKDFNW